MSVLHDLINNDFYCECKKDVVETTATSYVEVSPDIGIILKCDEEVLRARKGDLIEQLVYVDPETSEVTTITGALHQVMVITKRINQRDYIRLEGLIIDRSKEFNADLVRIPIANIRGFKGNSSSPEDIKIYNIKLEGDTISFATLFEPSMVMWNGEAIEVTKSTGSSASEGDTYTAKVSVVLKNNTLTVVGTGTSVTTRTVEGTVPGVEPTLDDQMVVDVVNGMSALYEALAGATEAPTITPDSTMYVPILHDVYGVTTVRFLSGTAEIAEYDLEKTVDVFLGAGVAEAAFIVTNNNTLCVLAPVLADLMVNHPETPIKVEVNGFGMELCETPSTWVQPLNMTNAALHGSLDPEDSILFAGNETTVERSNTAVGAAITLADVSGTQLDVGTMVIEHNMSEDYECYLITMAGDPDPNATIVVNTNNAATMSAREVVTTTETLNLFVPGTGIGQFKVIFKDVLPKAKPEIATGYSGTKTVKAIKDIQAEMEAVAGTSDVLTPDDVEDLLYMPLLTHVDEQFTTLNMHVTCPDNTVVTANLDGGDDGDMEVENFSYAETDTIEVVYNGVSLEAAPFKVDTETATVKINVLLLAYLAVLDMKENLIFDVDGVLVALPDLTEFAGTLAVTGATLVGGTHATNKIEFTDDSISATVSDYSSSVAFSIGTDTSTELPVATIGLVMENIDHATHKIRNMEFVKVPDNHYIKTVALCSPVDGGVIGDVEASNYTSNAHMFIIPGVGADVITIDTTFTPPIAVGPELDNDSTQAAMAAALENPTMTDDSYVMLAENVEDTPKQVTIRFISGSTPVTTKTATITPDMMIRVGDASNMASVPVLKHRYDNLLIHVAAVARLKDLFSDVGGTIEMDICGDTIRTSTLDQSGIFNTVGVKSVELLDAKHSVEEASNDGNVVTVSRYFNTTGVKICMDFDEDLVLAETNAKGMVIYSDPIPVGNADITNVISSIMAMVTHLPGKKFEMVCAYGPTVDGIIEADATTTVDILNVTLKASADVRVIWEDHASNTVPEILGVSEMFTTEGVVDRLNAVIDASGPDPDVYVKLDSGEWTVVPAEGEAPDPLTARLVGAIETVVAIPEMVHMVDVVTTVNGVNTSHAVTFDTEAGGDIIYPSDSLNGYINLPIGVDVNDKISVAKAFLVRNKISGKYSLYLNTFAYYPLFHEAHMNPDMAMKICLYNLANSSIYEIENVDLNTSANRCTLEAVVSAGWHELPPELNSATVVNDEDAGTCVTELVMYDTAFSTQIKWGTVDPVEDGLHGFIAYDVDAFKAGNAAIRGVRKFDDDGWTFGYRGATPGENITTAQARFLEGQSMIAVPGQYVTLAQTYITKKVPTFNGKQYEMADSCTGDVVMDAFENYATITPGTTPEECEGRVAIIGHRIEARPTRVAFKHATTSLPSGVDPVIAMYRPGFFSATVSDSVSHIERKQVGFDSSGDIMDIMYTEADSNGNYHLEVNAVALLEIMRAMVADDGGNIIVDIYTDDTIGAEPSYRTMLTSAAIPKVDNAVITSVEGNGVLHTTPPYNNTVESSVDADGTYVVAIARFDTGYGVKAVFETVDNGSLPGALCVQPELNETSGVQGNHTIDTVWIRALDTDGSCTLLEATTPPSDLTSSSSYTGTAVGVYFIDPTIDRDISYIRYRVDIRNKITESARPLDPVSNFGIDYQVSMDTVAQRFAYVENNNGTLPPEFTAAEMNKTCVRVTDLLPLEGAITSVVVGVYKTSNNEKMISHTYEADFDGTNYVAPKIYIRMKTNPDAILGVIDAYRSYQSGSTRRFYVSWVALHGALTRVAQKANASIDEYCAVDVYTTAPEHYHYQIKIPFNQYYNSSDVISLGITSPDAVSGAGGIHSESPYTNRVLVQANMANYAFIDVIRYDTGYGVKIPITGIDVTNSTKPSSCPVNEWIIGTVGGTEDFVHGKGIDAIYMERTDSSGNMWFIPQTNDPQDITESKETLIFTQWVYVPISHKFNNYWCGRVDLEGTLTELPPKSPDVSKDLNEMSVRTAFANLNGHASNTVNQFTDEEKAGLRVPLLDHVLQSKPIGVRFTDDEGHQYYCFNSDNTTVTQHTLAHHTETSMGTMPVMVSEANTLDLYDLKVSSIAILHVLLNFDKDSLVAHIYNDTTDNVNAYKAGTIESREGDIVVSIPDIFAETAKLEVDRFPMADSTMNFAPRNYSEWGDISSENNFRDINIYRYEKCVTAYAKMIGSLNDAEQEIDMRVDDVFVYINRDNSENAYPNILNHVNVGGCHTGGYVTLIQGNASDTSTFTSETTSSVTMSDLFAAPPDREVGYVGKLYVNLISHNKVVPTVVATPEATNIWDSSVNDQIKEVVTTVLNDTNIYGSGSYVPAEGMDEKVMLSIGTFTQSPYYVEIQQINTRYEAQNHVQRIGYPVGEENERTPGDSKFRLHMTGYNDDKVWEMDAVTSTLNEETGRYEVKINVLAYLEQMYAAAIYDNDFRFRVWFSEIDKPVWVQVNHTNILPEIRADYGTTKTIPHGASISAYNAFGGYHNRSDATNNYTATNGNVVINRYDSGYNLGFQFGDAVPWQVATEKYLYFVKDKVSNKYNDMYRVDMGPKGHPILSADKVVKYYFDKAKTEKYSPLGMLSLSDNGTEAHGWYEVIDLTINDLVDDAEVPKVSEGYTTENLIKAYNAVAAFGNETEITPEIQKACYVPIIDDVLPNIPVAIRLVAADATNYPPSSSTAVGFYMTLKNNRQTDVGAAHQYIAMYDGNSTSEAGRSSAYYNGYYETDATTYGIGIHALNLIKFLSEIGLTKEFVLQVFYDATGVGNVTGGTPNLEIIVPNLLSYSQFGHARAYASGGIHVYEPECNTATYEADYTSSYGHAFTATRYDRLGYAGIEYTTSAYPNGIPASATPRKYFNINIDDTGNVTNAHIFTMDGEGHNQIALFKPDTVNIVPSTEEKSEIVSGRYLSLMASSDNNELYCVGYDTMDIYEQPKIGVVDQSTFNFGTYEYEKQYKTAYVNARLLLANEIAEQYEAGEIALTDDQKNLLYMSIGTDTTFTFKPMKARLYHLDPSSYTPISIEKTGAGSSGYGELWQVPVDETSPDNQISIYKDSETSDPVVTMPIVRTTQAKNGNWLMELNVLSLLHMINIAGRAGYAMDLIVYGINPTGDGVLTRTIRLVAGDTTLVTNTNHVRMKIAGVELYNSNIDENTVSMVDNGAKITLNRWSTGVGTKVKLTGDKDGTDTVDTHKSKLVYKTPRLAVTGPNIKDNYHVFVITKTDADGYVISIRGEEPDAEFTVATTERDFTRFLVDTIGTSNAYFAMYGVDTTIVNKIPPEAEEAGPGDDETYEDTPI